MRHLLIASFCFMASSAMADVWSFNTPSGNIECWVGQEVGHADISCTIFKRTAILPQLPGCPASQGLTVEMTNRGYVRATCLAPTERPLGGQSVANYGMSDNFGGITCHSSRKGLDCRNQDGHGFFLSRAVQQAF